MGALPTKYDDARKGKEPLEVKIHFCGAWGYKTRYRTLKAWLKQQPFAPFIRVKGIQDLYKTGNFEITAGGKLLHSRRKKRGGYVNSKPEQQKLYKKIDELLMTA